MYRRQSITPPDKNNKKSKSRSPDVINRGLEKRDLVERCVRDLPYKASIFDTQDTKSYSSIIL